MTLHNLRGVIPSNSMCIIHIGRGGCGCGRGICIHSKGQEHRGGI